MAKAMSKAQLVAHFAKKFDLTKKTAGLIFEEQARLAYKEAKNSYTLPGIGKLVLVDRKARMGRNPATGQTIEIPAKTVVKFRVAKACKEAVLPKRSFPRPTPPPFQPTM
ncbi:MAG: HU family DNA-binding protein [Bacteroidota bacterium]